MDDEFWFIIQDLGCNINIIKPNSLLKQNKKWFQFQLNFKKFGKQEENSLSIY